MRRQPYNFRRSIRRNRSPPSRTDIWTGRSNSSRIPTSCLAGYRTIGCSLSSSGGDCKDGRGVTFVTHSRPPRNRVTRPAIMRRVRRSLIDTCLAVCAIACAARTAAPCGAAHDHDPRVLFTPELGVDAVPVARACLFINHEFDFATALGLDLIGPGLAASNRMMAAGRTHSPASIKRRLTQRSCSSSPSRHTCPGGQRRCV